MLHVIDRTWVPSQRELAAGIGYGFGTTINIINGGIGAGAEQGQGAAGQPHPLLGRAGGPLQDPSAPGREEHLLATDPMAVSAERRHRRALHQLGRQLEILPRQAGRLLLRVRAGGIPDRLLGPGAGDYEKCVTNFYGFHASWPKVRVVAQLDPAPVDPRHAAGGRGACLGGRQGLYRGQQGEPQGVIYQAKWWTQGNEPGKGIPGHR